jgi:hypothetical protein
VSYPARSICASCVTNIRTRSTILHSRRGCATTRGSLPAEQSADDLQRFLESADTMVEGEAKRAIFWFVSARAQAKDQPAIADFVDGVRHFGQ